MSDTAYSIRNNETNMQFEIEADGEIASMLYRFYKDSIAFMHTTVPKALEGKGIASALVKGAFAYSQKHHKPVMVYCPFVAEFIKKHPEYQQQLDPGYHKQ
ncbi:GNAT family N-acetyltransferase [Cytophagaceae bacterium YF14B1]|uniref:GNAT family N-acetyltransferase n=1 Tax=Xanthocytophaga flava TaxID=3048013 RepID=A0AAE3QW57_9BACT|nr:GNAT family N-acetyltransferase [Xanthocytophaga flavus]MDJ1484513.1 GNAT family N-acetyltransferase [Xanthocytophaga flavus]